MAAPLQIGRYVLHGEIASGGMATVHYGRLVGAAGFSRTVAIKRLHRSLAHNESFRKMILEEGRLAARVRHPNVVPPLDVLAEGGELLLVMEYVHGESLSRLLRASTKQGDRVPLPIAGTILSNVLHGLHAAHEAHDEAGVPLDIVHRDVSPQNILVGVDGAARVIDFGIAKAVTSESATTAGTIKGKVPYLSPEQLEGEPATRRTDIYAASVVLWELLAGRRLFEGADDAEILRNILFLEVKPPSAYNPLVPREVDDVVLRGLQRAPTERYPTARDMAVAIEESVHLATPTVVGAWAERLAQETLADRAEKIKDVEATPAILPEPIPTSAPIPASVPISVPIPISVQQPPVSPPPASRPPVSQRTLPLGLAEQDSDVAIPAPPPPKRPTLPPSAFASSDAPPSTRRPPAQIAKPSVRVSSPPVRPPAPSIQAIEPRTVIYEPPPLPEPEFIEGVRAIEPLPQAPERLMPTFPAANHPERPSSTSLAPPPAGALRMPALEIRNVDWLPVQAPPTSAPGAGFKRFLRYLAAFLVLTLIVGYMFAPALMRAWIVTTAASKGITVAIDEVEVSAKELRLSGFKAESKDLPGCSVNAKTVTLSLDWLRPTKLTIDDAELALDGSYVTASERFDAFKAKQPGLFDQMASRLRRVEVTSGRIDWKNAIGANTSALVENITFDMERVGVRPLGADYHMTAPLFTMRIADGQAGPWQLDLDRQGILARAIVHFDPSGSYNATLTRTAADDGSLSLSFQIPATALRDLHLPRSVLGAFATDRTRLEAKGEISVVSPQAATKSAVRSLSGHLVLGATSLPVFPSGPLVDLSLDLPLDGPTAQPIPLTGALGVALSDGIGAIAATGALVGTLDVSARSAHVVLNGQTIPIPCLGAEPVKKSARSQGFAGPMTGVVGSVDATLDDYPGAKVSFKQVATCTPRLK